MAAHTQEALIRRIQETLRSSTDEGERRWAAREFEELRSDHLQTLDTIDEEVLGNVRVRSYLLFVDASQPGSLREPGAFHAWLARLVDTEINAFARKRKRRGPHQSLDGHEDDSPAALQAREALELEIVGQPRRPDRTGVSWWSQWHMMGVEHIVEDRGVRSLFHALLESHIRGETMRATVWSRRARSRVGLERWAFRHVLDVALKAFRLVKNTLTRTHTALVFSYEFESEGRWSRRGWREIRRLARLVIHALMDNLAHSGVPITNAIRSEVDPERANTFDKRVRLLRLELHRAFVEAGLVAAASPRQFHLEDKARAKRRTERARR